MPITFLLMIVPPLLFNHILILTHIRLYVNTLIYLLSLVIYLRFDFSKTARFFVPVSLVSAYLCVLRIKNTCPKAASTPPFRR